MLIACSFIMVGASAQTKSGILLGGSPWGSVNAKLDTERFSRYDIHYKPNVMLGYRFRMLAENTPLFYDADVTIGLNNWNSGYKEKNNQQESEPNNGQYDYYYNYQARNNYLHAAVAVTANYTLFKNFSTGLGVAPTWWFAHAGEKSSNKFDVPLVVKIGYNLKYFELGLSYKHGLMNSIKTDYIQSGNFRDVQLTLWIPF